MVKLAIRYIQDGLSGLWSLFLPATARFRIMLVVATAILLVRFVYDILTIV